MKKTFPLVARNKAMARVVDSIKHEVRKYVKRERAKPLPEGFTAWEFDCRVGATPETAERKDLGDVGRAIDAVAVPEATGVFVEIVARAGHRFPPGGSPR